MSPSSLRGDAGQGHDVLFLLSVLVLEIDPVPAFPDLIHCVSPSRAGTGT